MLTTFIAGFGSLMAPSVQCQNIDSLIQKVQHMKPDTTKAMVYNRISRLLIMGPDHARAKQYADSALWLSESIHFDKGRARSLRHMAVILYFSGHYAECFDLINQSYLIAHEIKVQDEIGNSAMVMGILHSRVGLSDKAISLYKESVMALRGERDQLSSIIMTYNNIGREFNKDNKQDSAIIYLKKGIEVAKKIGTEEEIGLYYCNLGNTYTQINQLDSAKIYLYKGLAMIEKYTPDADLGRVYVMMANYHYTKGDYETALSFIKKAEKIAEELQRMQDMEEVFRTMSDIYLAMGNDKKASLYLKKHQAVSDSINSESMTQRLLQSIFESQYERLKVIDDLTDAKRELEAKDKQARARLEKTMWIATMIVILLVTGFIYANYQQKMKDNELLTNKKEEIEQKNEQLHAAIEENTNLTNMVIHDLKSPINNIKSVTNLIRLQGEKGDISELLNFLEQSVVNAENLVSNLNLINSLEHGGLEVKNKSLIPGSLIMDRVESFRQTAFEKQIEILVKVGKEKPMVTDEFMLGSVIDNLLSNAIKFSLSRSHIWVSGEFKNGCYEFSVKDEGQGILPEEKHLLFQKFKKLSARPTNKESSTGLGLSIVKEMVTKLGGTIKVVSEINQGAEFIVRIPSRISAYEEEMIVC